MQSVYRLSKFTMVHHQPRLLRGHMHDSLVYFLDNV